VAAYFCRRSRSAGSRGSVFWALRQLPGLQNPWNPCGPVYAICDGLPKARPIAFRRSGVFEGASDADHCSRAARGQPLHALTQKSCPIPYPPLCVCLLHKELVTLEARHKATAPATIQGHRQSGRRQPRQIAARHSRRALQY
jgi:hypothetical protein